MIQLTRLNHGPLILNCDLIEHVEITPDTVVALVTGQRFMVLESANEVVELVRAFRRSISQRPPALAVINVAGEAECASSPSRE